MAFSEANLNPFVHACSRLAGEPQTYSVSGGSSLVKNWAAILGPRGIRLDAVAPGVVDTETTSSRSRASVTVLHPREPSRCNVLVSEQAEG